MISAFTQDTQNSTTNQRFIFFRFSEFAAENRVSCSLQGLVIIDLSKNIHYDLVLHLRWLEDGVGDGLVREDDVASERLLKGKLCGPYRLRAGGKGPGEFVGCISEFRSGETSLGRFCGWRWRSGGIHSQYRSSVSG